MIYYVKSLLFMRFGRCSPCSSVRLAGCVVNKVLGKKH